MASEQANDLKRSVQALKAHWKNGAPKNMRATFADDSKRFSRYSLQLDDLLLDWSKCLVNDETLSCLAIWQKSRTSRSRRDAMFAGKPINNTEGRAVLHIALRNRSGKPIKVDGEDVMPGVKEVLDRMAAFADGLRSGSIKGSKNKPITDVVNIGIGGSILDPPWRRSPCRRTMTGRGCISSPTSMARTSLIRLPVSILRRH